MPSYKFDNIAIKDTTSKYNPNSIIYSYTESLTKNIKIDGCYEDLEKISADDPRRRTKKSAAEKSIGDYAAAISSSQSVLIVTDAAWIMHRAMENLNYPADLKKYGIGILPSKILWLADNGYSFVPFTAEKDIQDIDLNLKKQINIPAGETYIVAIPPAKIPSLISINCDYLLHPRSKEKAQPIIDKLQELFAQPVFGKQYEHDPSITRFANRRGIALRDPSVKREFLKDFFSASSQNSSWRNNKSTQPQKTPILSEEKIITKPRRSFTSPVRPCTISSELSIFKQEPITQDSSTNHPSPPAKKSYLG